MKKKSNATKILTLLLAFCVNFNIVEAASFPGKSNLIVRRGLSSFTGIEDILRSANPVTMQSIIQNQDSVAAMAFYSSMGSQIATYLDNIYNENLGEEVGDMPQAMVVLGLFQWGVERNLGPITPQEFVPDDDKALNCFIGAVNGIIGISDVVGLYNEFKNGASIKTVLRSLRVALRRVATVFVIVTSVYGLGSCMNWW